MNTTPTPTAKKAAYLAAARSTPNDLSLEKLFEEVPDDSRVSDISDEELDDLKRQFFNANDGRGVGSW